MFKFLVFFSLLFSSSSYGACQCVCMEGKNQPLCSSSMDLPPICPPKICPIEPPSIAPLGLPSLPPVGTTRCAQQQVLNNYTGRYEWQEVCR